jgi:hypothetical protein
MVGEVASIIHPYGVGIDCHSRFIQICVLARSEEKVVRYDETFSTELGGVDLDELQPTGEPLDKTRPM